MNKLIKKHRFEILTEEYQERIEELKGKISTMDQYEDSADIHTCKRRIDELTWRIRCMSKIMDGLFDTKVYPMLIAYRPMKTATRGLERMCEGFFNISKEDLTFSEFFQYTKEEIVQAPPKFGATSYETIIRMLTHNGYDYPEIP